MTTAYGDPCRECAQAGRQQIHGPLVVEAYGPGEITGFYCCNKGHQWTRQWAIDTSGDTRG